MASVAMVVTNACSPDPRVLRSAKVLSSAGHDVTIHAFDRNQASQMSESRDGFRIMRYHIGSFSYGAKWSTLKGKRAFNKTVISTLLANPPKCVYCHDADTLAIGVKVANKLERGWSMTCMTCIIHGLSWGDQGRFFAVLLQERWNAPP